MVVGLIIITCLFIFSNSRVDYGELTEVRVKHMGTMIPSGDEYILTLENGGWVAACNQIDWNKDNINKLIVDDSFVSNIKEIFEENKAHKLDDFNVEFEIEKKLAPIQTDGVNFKFYMRFSDGSVTEMEEYAIYPEKYRRISNAFEEQYKILFNE